MSIERGRAKYGLSYTTITTSMSLQCPDTASISCRGYVQGRATITQVTGFKEGYVDSEPGYKILETATDFNIFQVGLKHDVS